MSRPDKYWILSAAWVAGIYSSLYIVRPVCEYLKAHTPFILIVNGFVSFCGLVLVAYCTQRVNQWTDRLLILGVVGLYAWTLSAIEYPEEKFHLLQYGILAFLLYKAFAGKVPFPWSYLWAFLTASVLGWVDEGIQHLLPNRYYQNGDVLLNALASALGLMLTWALTRPGRDSRIKKL